MFSENMYMKDNQPLNNSSFGPISINPSQTMQNNILFTDPSTAWFSTSLDSNSNSSFGQSPVFNGMVTPSTSTDNHIQLEENNQRQHQDLFEKRKKRRESHNAVERRRRDNINERIQELSSLLPDHLVESVPASANVMTITTGQSGIHGKPINKGNVLKLSVDYIHELKTQVSQYKNRIQELENLIQISKSNNNINSVQFQQQFGKLYIE